MSVSCSYHTLTLDDNGFVWAFGRNDKGQCGIDTKGEDVEVPTKIEKLESVIQIVTGCKSSVCVDVDGHVWSFGDNSLGQLGLGDFKTVFTPTRVEGLDNIVAVARGRDHTLCLSSDSVLYGFGRNHMGQLGIPTKSQYNSIPKVIPLDEKIRTIACGGGHSVLLTFDGDVWVCGHNRFGQLGLGDDEDKTFFIKNPNLSDIVSVSCGIFHTILMNSEGEIFSSGNNMIGQLCLNDKENRSLPQKVLFSGEIYSISCGCYYTMFLDTSNRVWVFGMTNLNEDTIDGYHRGVMLQEPSNVCLLSSGGYHVLLKCTSNEIWAFGNNENNQLGLSSRNLSTKVIRKPEKLPSSYSHIIGTPIDIFKSRTKSARK